MPRHPNVPPSRDPRHSSQALEFANPTSSLKISFGITRGHIAQSYSSSSFFTIGVKKARPQPPRPSLTIIKPRSSSDGTSASHLGLLPLTQPASPLPYLSSDNPSHQSNTTTSIERSFPRTFDRAHQLNNSRRRLHLLTSSLLSSSYPSPLNSTISTGIPRGQNPSPADP